VTGRYGYGRFIVDTVPCPDCGFPADPVVGGDHGGGCLPPAETAAAIIRRHARNTEIFSANEVRSEFDRYGIPGPSRGRAFSAAIRAGVIARAGHVASTDEATHGHEVKSYSSLIYRSAA
jgi:hypothetical protein